MLGCKNMSKHLPEQIDSDIEFNIEMSHKSRQVVKVYRYLHRVYSGVKYEVIIATQKKMSYGHQPLDYEIDQVGIKHLFWKTDPYTLKEGYYEVKMVDIERDPVTGKICTWELDLIPFEPESHQDLEDR